MARAKTIMKKTIKARIIIAAGLEIATPEVSAKKSLFLV